MKISIIIPTYNCGGFIKKAIDSVLDQPYVNKELIVIDGGSKDATLAILKSYGDKIRYVSEPDKGQGDAINKGLKISTGEIVTWLNADDYYEPNIFGIVTDRFKNNPAASVVYGKCNAVSTDKVEINIPPKEVTITKMIANGNYICQPASFYLKSLMENNPIDISLYFWMEYDLFINLLKKGPAIFIDKILANFTIRDGQKTGSNNKTRMADEIYRLSRKYGGKKYSKLYFKYIVSKIFH